jgi:hypothetical protein
LGKAKKTEFLLNRTGDELHSDRARSARHTAKTLAIFANRRTKNRNNFGKFDSGADLQPSSNFFPKFGLASAPLPPANFEEVCVPKQKNFLCIFLMSRAQIFFKKEKKIFCFGFLQKAKRRKRNISIYIFLSLYFWPSLPRNPTRARTASWNSLFRN